MPKKYDLTNQKFGRLTVLYRSEKIVSNTHPWHCRCECGNECDVMTQHLMSGHTKSCGCLQKEKASKIGKQTIDYARDKQRIDLTNQRFGRLVAISLAPRDKVKTNSWICQ